MKDLIVIGAGGFGREVISTVLSHNSQHPAHAWNLLGVVDDGPSEVNLGRLGRLGVAFLGSIADNSERLAATESVIGVGIPQVRQKIAARLDELGAPAAVIVDPSAQIGADSVLAPGVVVCAGVAISTNVRVGRHGHVNPNATIGHDAELAQFVSINPGATVSGDVYVDSGSLVGAGAVILQGLRIGDNVTVGAAACVTRDVPSGVIVKGIPAR